MDSLLIRLFNKTCALSFTQGWVCGRQFSIPGLGFQPQLTCGSFWDKPFRISIWLIHSIFVWLSRKSTVLRPSFQNWLGQISAAMVLPLSVMSLVQNIKFQLASVVILLFVMSSWVFIFAKQGFDLPTLAIGSNQSSLIGFVLNNFAFVGLPLRWKPLRSLTVTRLPLYRHSSTSCRVLFPSTGSLATRSWYV